MLVPLQFHYEGMLILADILEIAVAILQVIFFIILVTSFKSYPQFGFFFNLRNLPPWLSSSAKTASSAGLFLSMCVQLILI